MARKKISEFSAKSFLHEYLELPYQGMSFDASVDTLGKIDEFVDSSQKYVVKVDEGVKKRMKQGLVALDLDITRIVEAIQAFRKKGYTYFIVEEYIPHEESLERYLAFERTDIGVIVYYSNHGGIDIEEHQETVEKTLVKGLEDVQEVSKVLGVDEEFFSKILEAFDIYYFSFLEINPFVIGVDKMYFLDVASEVDSAGEFFQGGWNALDFRDHEGTKKTAEEKNILALSEKSPSSFKLNILNPDGAIFMLLSGGGASIVLADEVANLGFGDKLANYGEYSGNPNEEETYIYAKNLLSLMLKSKSDKKVLIIGGGVANFTDIRITFKGIIRALSEVSDKLLEQNIKIFVRRGGPHQKEGLRLIEDFLEKEDLLGKVSDQTMVLTDIVKYALEEIQ